MQIAQPGEVGVAVVDVVGGKKIVELARVAVGGVVVAGGEVVLKLEPRLPAPLPEVAALGDEHGGAVAVGPALAELPGVLEAVAPAARGLVDAAKAERGDARRLRVIERPLAHRAQAIAQIESIQLGAAR